MCNCGKTTNISFGCCEPVLGPVENYYTKPTIDRKLEEITSAITSGCCITPEEVDEKIEEAISGITVSGVTEEELNEAIASAKTEIEAEIPVVPTSNTAFTNDAGYITGVDLSNYATKDNLTAATDDMATKTWVGQQGYLTQHQDISGKQDISGMTAYTETSAFTAHTSDNIIHVTNSEKAAWNAKADIWVGDETAWGQISGSTTNGTIYLVY